MPAKHQRRLTKKERRRLNQLGNDGSKFRLNTEVTPLTDNQRVAFESWKDGYNLMLHGIAGTGKTFLGLYFAINEVQKPSNDYKKVYILRSTVSTRNQGFLPGTQKQKEAVYELPYYDICSKLYGRGDSYEMLKKLNMVEFMTTSFLRGTTFEDCIVIVDEIQNFSAQETHTVMTRIGQNCKIIFCGDIKQDDLTSKRYNEETGLRDFMKIINTMKEFRVIEFEVDDIVRGDLVRSYILAKESLNL